MGFSGGGQGNFGINTEYRFKVHHAPTEATVFEIIWPWNQPEKAFKEWQKCTTFVDNRLGSIRKFFPKIMGCFMQQDYSWSQKRN